MHFFLNYSPAFSLSVATCNPWTFPKVYDLFQYKAKSIVPFINMDEIDEIT